MAVQIVVWGSEDGTVVSEAPGIKFVFIAVGGARVKIVVEVAVLDVEFVGVDTDDWTYVGRMAIIMKLFKTYILTCFLIVYTVFDTLCL